MPKKKQIRYVKWGLANFFEKRIELNRHLRNHPLKKYILAHEEGHSQGFDLVHEFDIKIWSIWFKVFGFILLHPSTWIDFLPIQFRKGRVVFDINMLILYALIIILLIIFKLMFF